MAYVELRTSESVSSRIRSGGSSSNARASSRIVSCPSGVSTSPLMLNAMATSSSPTGLGGSAARQPHGVARHVHPVDRTRPVREQRVRLADRRGEPPAVRAQDIAADLGVAAVHGLHARGVVDHGRDTPEVLLLLGADAGDVEQLRRDRAVEHDAPVTCDQLADPRVSAGDSGWLAQHPHASFDFSIPLTIETILSAGHPLKARIT